MSEILTIAEASRRIAARKLSPVELTKAHLDRIKRLDPALNAFLLVTEERALADAKAAEARQMSGGLRSRLDGIPIAHKDIYCTAGIRTTAHSKLLEHNVPTRDAYTVKKWADAGTVMNPASSFRVLSASMIEGNSPKRMASNSVPVVLVLEA